MTNIHFLSYFARFFLEWEMFQAKVVDKIKTHILWSVTFFLIVSFVRKCGKILYSGAGHRWRCGSWALHAGYLRLLIHTLSLYNTHCFSTATKVTRTLYMHSMSCCISYNHFMFSIPCIMDQFIKKSQQDVTSQYFISCFVTFLYMFRTRSGSIIRRSISLTAYATSGMVTVSCGRLSSWLSRDSAKKSDKTGNKVLWRDILLVFLDKL
jgi:hypothetical protein